MVAFLAIVFRSAFLLGLIIAPVGTSPAAEQRSGEQIYKQSCARCHGAKGEGVRSQHAKPLIGDRSLAELAHVVLKTMPEDDPGTLAGDDAQAVAEFVYNAFYSAVAQARSMPARVDLSRLTVTQYRDALADLVGSFRWPAKRDAPHGLHAVYAKSRETWKKEAQAFERDDPQIDFKFGEGSPDADKIPPEEFGIRWQGGVLAPETGEYEFILDTENGVELFLNDERKPLIDARVKSGNDTVYRQTIRLLAGRVYPVRIEFSKSKKGKEKTASITLKWRVPNRVEEVIPERNLLNMAPQKFPPVYVVETRFPPDDRSLGYERGSSVSEAWNDAATNAALDVAAFVEKNLDELAGTNAKAKDRAEKVRKFCSNWTERAFRRPLSDEQRQHYIDRHFDDQRPLEASVKRVVLASLLSPYFLYQDVNGPQYDAFDVASRLSFALWDSLPDQPLLQSAASGNLLKPDEVRRQALRMVDDPRTRAKLREFFLQWLNVDRFTDLAKDSKRYPDFDAAIVNDLRVSLELFLADVAWSQSSDFRELLTSDDLFVNGRLAELYGAQLPAEAPFQKINTPPGERAGVLTHPYLMAGFAYSATSSPIHRGVFVARSVLGRALRAPPVAVAPTPPDLQPDLTTRERVALQTKAVACNSCHRMINPLGFAFENFDAIGRYRTAEQGKPIDATGAYQTRTGDLVEFQNVSELAAYLAGSEETHEAFVEQLFHFIIKQPIRAFGPGTASRLEDKFAARQYNMRDLLIEIAVEAALPPRELKP